MQKKFFLLSLLAFPLMWISCNDDETPPDNLLTKLEIRMTDAPAAYDEVNIEVLSVFVKAQTERGSEWSAVYHLVQPGIYNLLEYQNGIDTLLVTDEVPAGSIKEIRLILGENNTVVKEGIEYPLTTPSAQESGLKIKLADDMVFEPGKTYRIWIDFDAGRSIHETGSGKIMLQPVIRAFAEAWGGSITGQITPPEPIYEVKAINGLDTLTTYPRNGYFTFIGLEPGNDWKLQLLTDTPDKWFPGSTYEESIIVKEGGATHIDIIFEFEK